MRAGIAIDAWKREIFERHLKRAGYSWTLAAGLTDETLTLFVETDDLQPLYSVIRDAQAEALAARAPVPGSVPTSGNRAARRATRSRRR